MTHNSPSNSDPPTRSAGGPPSPPPPADPPTRWAILIPAMTLLIAPILVISQIAAHMRVDVVDDQLFGYFGWRIAHGAVLYQDVWDNKPPGIYWTNALGFLLGGDHYAGVIVLCVLAVVASLTCFFLIANSVFSRGAAAVGTILAAFYFTHGFFQGGTNRTETFLMAFELAAVALYFRGFARDRWWKWYLAGICAGCAFLYKQVGLAAWGTMGLHTIILVLVRDLRWQTGLKRCLLLAGGMLTPVVAAALVIVARGAAGPAWFAIVTFNHAYFTEGNSSFKTLDLNDYRLRTHIRVALLLPVLMSIASLIHAVLWRLRPQFRPADVLPRVRKTEPGCPRYMLFFSIWYAAAYYGAAVSPHYFRHYLLPTMPPLMLLSAYLVNVLRAELSLTKRLQQRIWVTACFVAMGYFAVDSVRWHISAISKVWVYRYLEHRQPEWEVIGEAVKQLSTPAEHIQCLGYMPGVYLYARRINASRYVTTEKLGQVPHSEEAKIIRRQLRDQLEADRPALMVMSDNDYAMVQEAGPPGDDPDWLSWWLQGFLREHYRRALEVTECNVMIFRRRDLGPPQFRKNQP